MTIRSMPEVLRQELQARQKHIDELKLARDKAKTIYDQEQAKLDVARAELQAFKDDVALLPTRLKGA
jgi:hypothetical protein